jgi:predicted MFS family arabinose efflux permease
VIVDRLGFRRTSVIADIASAAAVAAIPLLDSTVGIELWQLMALVFLGALLDAPGATARAAILPDLATAASVPMERASGIRGSVQKGSQLIGGPLGGLLVAALGAPTALWVNAVSFLFSAALVAWAVPPTPGRRQEATSFRTDLVEGWRFVRQHRLILAIVLTVLITNFLDAPFSVAMPVLANEAYGGAAELGLMYGAYGGMALLGSLLPRLRPPSSPAPDTARRISGGSCVVPGAGLPAAASGCADHLGPGGICHRRAQSCHLYGGL